MHVRLCSHTALETTAVVRRHACPDRLADACTATSADGTVPHSTAGRIDAQGPTAQRTGHGSRVYDTPEAQQCVPRHITDRLRARQHQCTTQPSTTHRDSWGTTHVVDPHAAMARRSASVLSSIVSGMASTCMASGMRKGDAGVSHARATPICRPPAHMAACSHAPASPCGSTLPASIASSSSRSLSPG